MNKSLLGRVLGPALLGCGLLLVLSSTTSTAYAGGSLPTPEIDLNSAAGAVALLAGGLLVLTNRRKSS